MKTINALLVLSIASLLSACGGSGSGSGASSSSVSSMVESVSSQSSAVSVDASSVDASSSSLASSVADVSSSSPAISSVDMSSSGLAMSSVAMSSSSVITISSADASSSSLATSSIAASSSSLAISSSSIEASSSSLVSSSSVASSSSLAASSASTALYPSYNTNPIAPDMTGMESDAVQLAAKMKLGINVGNQMEATNCPQLELTQRETCWGHPKVSEAYIQLVKDRGFDAIRLPVSWDQYADQTTGKISDFWLNRVKEVVQYAVDNGLYVMVNIHWDGGWLERSFHEAAESETKKEAVKAKQKAYWEQIATHLREFDEHVMFASANEPDTSNDNESASVIASRVAVLDEYHQTFVDAVRSTGGKNAYRVLIIQAPKTDIDLATNNWFVMPSDTATGRQMAEVHFYPFSFTNQDADIVADWGTLQFFCYWGEGNHSETDTFRNSTREEEGFVDAKFAQMKTKFADQGIPVVLGEFAARPRSEEACSDYPKHLASRAYYAQYVTQASIENGMLPFFWDTGEVFERGTPAVNNQQVLDGLLIGSGKLNGSSSSSSAQSSAGTSSSAMSSSVQASSVPSSSSSSASNLVVLDTSPANWNVDSGVVKNESASHIEFTVNASNQGASYESATPVNMTNATMSVVFNFDEAFVTNRSGGMDGIMQFYAYSPSWANSQFTCWTGWTALVANQDVTFTCSDISLVDAVGFGFQFFATAGTVTIKSATITLAE